ncbi:MAG: ATP-binding protein [Coprobacillaceae bacterium]
MKIRTRIIVSNITVVIIALLLLLVTSSAVILNFRNSYTEESMVVDSNATEVKAILDTVDNNNISEIRKALSKYNYDVYTSDDAKLKDKKLDKQVDYALYSISWKETSKIIFSNGVTIIGRTQNEKTILAVNGLSSEQMIGKHSMDTMHNKFVVICAVSIAIIVLLSVWLSRRLVKRIMLPIDEITKGSKRIIQGEETTQIIYDKNDEFKTVCDAFNQMQEHLKDEKEKNASYEKARTDMIAGISHDLRTPLTSVQGYIKGLKDGVANTSEKQIQYLEVAHKKACDMEVLLGRLFYFSKLETGNLPFEMENVELGNFIREIAQDVQMEFLDDDGEIIVNCEGKHIIYADMEQIYRVFTNLIANAKHYANVKPLQIKIDIIKEGKMEVIIFSDNGIGVKPEMLEHIFEQFWRGDESRTLKDGEGSGLGLYIVKYIIEKHGGKIEAYNQDGLVIKMMIPSKEEEKQ